MNGVDPLIIPADTFFLYFHSDGNNNDWGYRFTVVGFVPTKVPRILRPPSSSLLLSRLVRIMAGDIVVKILATKPRAQVGDTEEEQRLAKHEKSVAEYFGPKLWRDVLHSLMTSCLSRGLTDLDGADMESAVSRLEVKLSSLPVQTEKRLATLLTMLLNNRCLVDPLRRDLFFGPSAAANPEFFQRIVDGFKCKPSEPAVWARDGLLDVEALSEDLVAAFSMEGLAPMHMPSDKCDVATLEASERLLDTDAEDDDAAQEFPKIRLECMPDTTHCRIRAGPSMETAEVGDFASGSVTYVSSEVGDFYRLADDRGFVKSYVDRALDWARILPVNSTGISYADQSSKYSKSAKKVELQVADYWESSLLQALEGVVMRSTYNLLCTVLNKWPKGVPFAPDNDGDVHLLLKATGMGVVTIPKGAAKKTQQTLYSKKRQSGGSNTGKLSNTPLLASFYKFLSAQDSQYSDGNLSPLVLSMLSIATGVLQQTHSKCSLERTVVVPVDPDPQTLLAPVVLESTHEYENNTDSLLRLHIPGARGLEIIFDDESSTERNYDHVIIYADIAKQNQLGGKYSGKRSSSERNFPGVGDQPSLIIDGRNEVFVHFVTDGTNVGTTFEQISIYISPIPSLKFLPTSPTINSLIQTGDGA